MVDTQPVVSVVVPAYNVERFLDQALSSVEAQTLRELEIICVNDGSTDGTADILREHAGRDRRIRVVSKPNGGYGSACNCGISEARGEWIAIFEPDDWVEAGMYADMVAYAATFSEPIDIVKTPYWRMVDPDTTQQRQLNCSYKGRIMPSRQPFTMEDGHVDHLLIHHPSIWSALYRKSFLDDFDIRFLEIPGAGWADNPFVVETLCQARSIVYLDRAYYHYREETASKSASFAQQHTDVAFARWHDMVDVLERIGMRTPSVLNAQYRRAFTYLDYIGEGIELDDERVRPIMERMFARMDDDLVFAEPNIPPVWKRRYQSVKGIPNRRISPVPYAISLAKASAYSLGNVGPAETLALVGNVAHRDKAAGNAGKTAPTPGKASAEIDPDFKLSVVVPVYNAERYLGECIDSLEAQTYGGFEAIFVNDGSTDGSRRMLEERASADSRFRIVDQRNGGPSSARNEGIRVATGDYVCFLDSDDVLEPDALECIARAAADGGPDVISFGWSCDPAERANAWLTERTCVRDAYFPRFTPAILFDEMTNPYLRSAVRRALLAEQSISFDEGLRIGEDCAFLFSLFPRAGAVRLVSNRLYRYRMPHEGSIMSMSSEGTPEKCIDDVLMAISIFGDWSRGGFLGPYGHHLVHWFIVLQLYTILRLPAPVRNDVVALVKQLWLAHYSADELRALAVPDRDRALIDVVLSSNDDGSLSGTKSDLRKTMLRWRIAEYGIADLARTAFERAGKPS